MFICQWDWTHREKCEKWERGTLQGEVLEYLSGEKTPEYMGSWLWIDRNTYSIKTGGEAKTTGVDTVGVVAPCVCDSVIGWKGTGKRRGVRTWRRHMCHHPSGEWKSELTREMGWTVRQCWIPVWVRCVVMNLTWDQPVGLCGFLWEC